MKIFGREPAAWVALATIIVQAIGAFWAGFTPTTQGWVIAVVSTATGLIVAIVTHDGVIAAISGFAQAALSLAVGLGVHMDTHQQFYVMAVVTAVAQWFTRQNVVAPVSPGAFRPVKILPAKQSTQEA